MKTSKQFTIFTSNSCQKAEDISFPNEKHISSLEDLVNAAKHDWVNGKMANSISIPSYRCKANFIKADSITLDFDNTDSDDESEWIDSDEFQRRLPNVMTGIVYSRNHMRVKDGRKPRPRFHAIIAAGEISSAEEYEELTARMASLFPEMDMKCRDAAHMFFGVANPEAILLEGQLTLKEYLYFNSVKNIEKENSKMNAKINLNINNPIPVGERNDTLHKAGLNYAVRYGVNGLDAELSRCNDSCIEKLSESEIRSISDSIQSYLNDNVANDPLYIPPDVYNGYYPHAFNDVEEATLFVNKFGGICKYTTSMGWLSYDGKKWVIGSLHVNQLFNSFVKEQLTKANKWFSDFNEKFKESDNYGKKYAENIVKGRKQITSLLSFVTKYGNNTKIQSALKQAESMLVIDGAIFDSNPWLLNTPNGTVDLKTGEIREHRAEDYCTKMCTVSPTFGNQDKSAWKNFLDQITGNDASLEKYLQLCAGMSLIGKVFSENLLILYGEGGNGKSTYLNTLSKILGDYSGRIGSELFEKGPYKRPFGTAELQGKRLAVVNEIDSMAELNTAMVKQLCSTDRVTAERKFQEQFSFAPSHTIMLSCNHLPKIGQYDLAIADRIRIIPFTVRFRNTVNEIKNLADRLVEDCGSEILEWMITGAKEYCEAEYVIEEPEAIQALCGKCKEQNNFLSDFIEECCEKHLSSKVNLVKVYECYKIYCSKVNENVRSQNEFKQELISAGFAYSRQNKGYCFSGITLKAKLPWNNIESYEN